MIKRVVVLLTFVFVVGIAASARATVIPFDLVGTAGTGLLAGNQGGVLNGTPGSGGEVGAGISFDDATNILTINTGWGSGQGFTNLTGPTTGGHLHGPTASAAPTSFSQTAGIKYPLDTLPAGVTGTWN